MGRRIWDKSFAVATRYSGLGIALLAMSFLPVGSRYRSLLLKTTVPGAVMFLGIAVGLTAYGAARYPSRPMQLLAVVTVISAALCGVRLGLLDVAP